MKKTTYLFGLLVLFFTFPIFAQIAVTGTITDEAGDPIPGVTILIVGTNQGTTSDFDGNFTLNVPDNAQLEISSIGFASQTINVGNQSTLSIVLTESLSELDEIVVTGYGVQTRGSISGSVASVNVGDAVKVPVARPKTTFFLDCLMSIAISVATAFEATLASLKSKLCIFSKRLISVVPGA